MNRLIWAQLKQHVAQHMIRALEQGDSPAFWQCVQDYGRIREAETLLARYATPLPSDTYCDQNADGHQS